MPPRRPRRKAAIEAKARFGGDKNRSARRPGKQSAPQEGGAGSDKPKEEPVEEQVEEEEPEMKAEEGGTEPAGGKAVNGERQNEGEASTAPVPEKVIFKNVLRDWVVSRLLDVPFRVDAVTQCDCHMVFSDTGFNWWVARILCGTETG
jgi:hypothetical protein